ncbi:MAG: hypothetical protein M1587_08220 [Thaumarchaeota archaeon]|nr:hypothetical protein [Nitrososphaerota archaeon]
MATQALNRTGSTEKILKIQIWDDCVSRLALSKEVSSSRPARRLTLFFIATAGTFTAYATVLGAIQLSTLSGVPVNIGAYFEAHPYLQIFGFLAEFVMGVGYSLLPLFKSRQMHHLELGYLAYVSITLANVLLAISSFDLEAYAELAKIASILILFSSIIFATQALNLLRRPSNFLAEAEPFMILSVVSFLILSLYFVEFSLVNEDVFSIYFLYLSLLGFVGSMIFGVMLRTIAFRLTTYRKRLATLTFLFQAIAVALIGVSATVQVKYLTEASAILFLVSSISMIFTARIFEKSRKLLPFGAKAAMPNRIQVYTDAAEMSGSIWLVLGCILGMALVAVPSFLLRDLFIHVIAIGFIGSIIIGYAPVLLPGVLTSKGPREKLSLWPLGFLDAGLVFRLAGNTYAKVNSSGLPSWESISGILIILSMISFGYSLHSRRSNEDLR